MGREGKQGQETNSISELPHPNTKKLIIIIIMKIKKIYIYRELTQHGKDPSMRSLSSPPTQFVMEPQ